MSRKKVGLVLGSGSARGLAHIGVLRVLKEENIPVDMIAGTSIGALVGAMYALRRNIARVEAIADNMKWSRLLSLVDLTIPKTGLIRGQRLLAWGRSLIGRDILFSDLEIPFACVATDIMDGQETVINEGSVTEAVRASISIPGIFSPAKRGNRYFVDGGLVNPIPVSIVKNMGAEFVIAVNILPDTGGGDRTYMVEGRGKKALKEPSIIDILMQSIYIGSRPLIRTALKSADIVIEPDVTYIGPSEFHRASECILQGALAAADCIPKLKRLLAVT
ncbi:MAG: patatin-like phospholipase family protein [Dehalococcoidales bacterium]|nr:patatin-like phospholipase family protein [Dehalococcoidales bacterium]